MRASVDAPNLDKKSPPIAAHNIKELYVIRFFNRTLKLRGKNSLFITHKNKPKHTKQTLESELREPDLNRRPSDNESDELPDCSTPRH